MEKRKVTKLMAAEEQLNSAIDLHFSGGHDIAAYTLVRASHEILDRLCKKRGVKSSTLEESINQYAPKEKLKSIQKKVNEAKNFFKHVSTDPDLTIDWNSGLTEYFLWDAGTMFIRITGRKNCRILAFCTIFRCQHSELWDEDYPPFMDRHSFIDAKEELNRFGPKKVYEDFLLQCLAIS